MSILTSVQKWYKGMSLSRFFSVFLVLLLFQLSLLLLDANKFFSSGIYMFILAFCVIFCFVCIVLMMYNFLEVSLSEKKYSGIAFTSKIILFVAQNYLLVQTFVPLQTSSDPKWVFTILFIFQLLFVAQIFLYYQKFLPVTILTTVFYGLITAISHLNLLIQINIYSPRWYEYTLLAFSGAGLILQMFIIYRSSLLIKQRPKELG